MNGTAIKQHNNAAQAGIYGAYRRKIAGIQAAANLPAKTLLAMFALFALALSVLFLSGQSMRLDEAQSLWQSSRTPSGILYIIAQDVHVPLYGLLLHYWQMFFGNDIALVRLFSLLFFLAGVPAIYYMGKTVYGKNVGLYGALLFAVSPFLNWYANEVRMYSMLLLITILNQIFFLKIFKAGKRINKAPAPVLFWAGYGITGLLGIYTHYFFWLVLGIQALFFLFYRHLFPAGTLKRLAVIFALLVGSLLPWLFYVNQLNMASNASPVLIKPTAVNLFNTFSQFIFGFQDDHLNTVIISLWPLSVLFIFLSLKKSQKISPETAYLFMSAILPVIAVFLISIAFRPLFITRYLILTVPALYLFIAWFLTVYPKRLAAGLKILLVFMMLATLFVQIDNSDTPVKENYQSASEYLNSSTSASDVVIISAPFTIYPVEYYYRGPARLTTLPQWDRYRTGPIPAFTEEKLPAEVSQLKEGHYRAFLLLSYDQGYENIVKYYFDTRFHRLESKNFSPGLNLYVYQLGYNDPTFENILNAVNGGSEIEK